MKAVILAGGLGARLSEETHLRPRTMHEIGGKPIRWHILKTYSHYGINEFIICCGYRGYKIKQYFANPNKRKNKKNEKQELRPYKQIQTAYLLSIN